MDDRALACSKTPRSILLVDCNNVRGFTPTHRALDDFCTAVWRWWRQLPQTEPTAVLLCVDHGSTSETRAVADGFSVAFSGPKCDADTDLVRAVDELLPLYPEASLRVVSNDRQLRSRCHRHLPKLNNERSSGNDWYSQHGLDKPGGRYEREFTRGKPRPSEQIDRLEFVDSQSFASELKAAGALVVTAATKAITRPSITQQFFENLVTWLPMLLLLICTAIYYPLATALLVLTMLLLHFAFTPKTTTPSQTASDSPFSMGEAAVAERLAHEGSGGKRKASQQKRKVGHKPPTWRQLEAEELIIRKVQLPPSIGSGGGGGAAAKVAMKAHVSVIMMLALCVPATAFSCAPVITPSQRSLLAPRMMSELETEQWDVGTEETPDMSLTAQQDESVAYDEMDEYYHKNNHADYMDDYYTFAKWWERTHAYEASAATIASQKRRVAYETALLQTPSPLELPVDLTPSEALEKDGVVRINSALSATTAAKLRAELLERRENAYAHVDGGGDWKPYFGDLVLKDGKKRCDLLLPLVGNRGVQLALRELLVGEGSTPPLLYELFSSTLSDDAVLYELSALISEPGSQRQMIHADNENQENGCVPLLTVFVSLQEVTPEMGGTVFLPATHTAEKHDEFACIGDPRDTLLRTTPTVVGLLGPGDASLYDSRVFHCGGANQLDGGSTRAIFYFSFLNPDADQSTVIRGSILPELKAKSYTLKELRDALATLTDDLDPFSDAEERADIARSYRVRAEAGESSAQRELGLCYSRGDGVEADANEANRWLTLAAENGDAAAMTHLGHINKRAGVEADAAETVKWYTLAAEQGDADALYNLGICYSRSHGVPRDIERALELHFKAAQQGHFAAKAQYDEIIRMHRDEIGDLDRFL